MISPLLFIYDDSFCIQLNVYEPGPETGQQDYRRSDVIQSKLARSYIT
jgi:hypothetical protein